MLRELVRRWADPRVDRYLLVDEGERIIDEVRHHWVIYTVPALELVLVLGLLVGLPFADMRIGWFVILVILLVAGHAGWRVLRAHMDRFVITNMRVFRVVGVFNRRRATMPMARILDISVQKPLLGRILGYGHFVFESAAQSQGLRDIRYVGDPDGRDLTIQRVVQEAGLRATPRQLREDTRDRPAPVPGSGDPDAGIGGSGVAGPGLGSAGGGGVPE